MNIGILFGIISGLIALLLFIKLVDLYIQIHKITKQLDDFIAGRTHKKVDVSLTDPFLECMAEKINHSIQIQEIMRISELRREKEIREDIANISHDLRTPLTAVIGYLSLSESEKNLTVRDNYINIAKNKALLLQRLVNDFFEMSYISSSTCQISLTRLDWNKIIQEELLTAYNIFKEKAITPQIELPEYPIMVFGDLLALERIFQNLISNAVCYTTGLIGIRLAVKDNCAFLFVKNSSTPIDAQEQEKLFQRFYRSEKERSVGHAGLGLYIVKQLTEKINGKVESNYQDGFFSIIIRLNMCPD